MKITLDANDIAQELYKDRENNSFSWDGCMALAAWLDEMDTEAGTNSEFDAVAIRCDYSEYGSAVDAVRDLYGDEVADGMGVDCDPQGAEWEEAAADYLRDRGFLIKFDGWVIVGAQ